MAKSLPAQLEEQLRLSFEGPAWHGPSVKEALVGVTAAEAAGHPIPSAHSIWELVLHLAGTYALVLRRVRGDTTQLSPTEDWPTITDTTEAAWTAAQEELRALNARLLAIVLEFPEDRLDETIISNSPYKAFTQFIGITQHDLYHAGQIVLLKKAIARRAT